MMEGLEALVPQPVRQLTEISAAAIAAVRRRIIVFFITNTISLWIYYG